MYPPIAHAVWHRDGFLYKAGALDFAGGDVVHVASGSSALVASIMVGKRRGKRFEPHNIALSLIGASFLWVGWSGFNGGSALSAGVNAGFAVATTHVAAAMGALGWMGMEWAVHKRPTVLSVISGAIAGLVGITPAWCAQHSAAASCCFEKGRQRLSSACWASQTRTAAALTLRHSCADAFPSPCPPLPPCSCATSGFVDFVGAFVIGLTTGVVCFYGVMLKEKFGFDDALDAFGLHGVGGIYGGLLTGLFANPKINPAHRGAFYGKPEQIYIQLYGIAVAFGYSAFMTWLILLPIKHTIGLRVHVAHEKVGQDKSIHGEKIDYHLEPEHLDRAVRRADAGDEADVESSGGARAACALPLPALPTESPLALSSSFISCTAGGLTWCSIISHCSSHHFPDAMVATAMRLLHRRRERQRHGGQDRSGGALAFQEAEPTAAEE